MERYDWYLCASVVSEVPLPEGRQPYSLIGLNLNDESLRVEPKEDFVALLDFEHEPDMHERAIQVQACQETGGVRYNRELLEVGRAPVGFEGFFDVGVEIPFFNRNQGHVQTARANLELATREVDRVKLSLRTRMAQAYKTYQDSLTLTERYRIQMIPRAKKAYGCIWKTTDKWRQPTHR